ncbi:MAG: hypothetical protein C0410_05585 [Anaerolinea sp.]|nr:hypothetical protein [Anaerolinea sp.]
MIERSENLCIGQILAGRYVINQRIAQLQNSSIYLASDLKIVGKTWAIKQLWQENEVSNLIKILGVVSHPSLPRVFDYFTENNQRYLVMDFIDGRTLFDLIYLYPQNEFLPESRIIAWLAQTCYVIDYLHNLPIPVLILDIKPDNIMLTSAGNIVMIDFGVARFYNSLEPLIIGGYGTPGYAPPEQMQSKPVDQRADIYGIGTTFFHIITKRKPEEFKVPLPDIRSINPNASEHLADIIKKCTAIEPEQRYVSIKELLSALFPFSIEQLIQAEKHFLQAIYFMQKWRIRDGQRELNKALSLAPSAKHLQDLENLSKEKYFNQQTNSVFIPEMENFEFLKSMGVNLLRSGIYDNAVVLLEKALHKNANDANLYHEIGVAYWSLGDFYKAISFFENAIKLGHKGAFTYDGLGDAYFGLGEWELSLEFHTLANLLSPAPRFVEKVKKDTEFLDTSRKYRQVVSLLKNSTEGDLDESILEQFEDYASLLLKQGETYANQKMVGFRKIAQFMFEKSVAVLEMARNKFSAKKIWHTLLQNYRDLEKLTGNNIWNERAIDLLEEISVGLDDSNAKKELISLYIQTGKVDKLQKLKSQERINNLSHAPIAISDVKGLGKIFLERLQSNGIDSLVKLASLDETELANILKTPKSKVSKILTEVRAIM